MFILHFIRVLDIFSWLIEVENVTKENRDSGKIIWSVNFVQDAGRMQNYSSEVLTSTMPFDGKRQKIIARFQIMKDDIQSILPIAKVFMLHCFSFQYIILDIKCFLKYTSYTCFSFFHFLYLFSIDLLINMNRIEN